MHRTAVIAVALTCASGFVVDAAGHKTIRIAEGIYAVQPVTRHGREEAVPERNAVFVIGRTGVAVIDTGISYREGRDIIAAVRRVSGGGPHAHYRLIKRSRRGD